MHIFRVWAPFASRVDVNISGRSRALGRDDDGWWTAQVVDAYPGQDYAYSVDGNDPRPDPRSGWQPNGVHCPSRILDSRFEWTDQKWNPRPLAAGIIYEMHVGTFTTAGTFLAAIEKLDYLVELGVTHLEMMPIAEFPGTWGWGYDGVDLFAPYHYYGTPDDLKRLVNACHERGLAVLLDVVYNHFGPDGNYLAQFGPYTTDKYRTPWGNAINLDSALSEGVRSFLIDNAVMWLRDCTLTGLGWMRSTRSSTRALAISWSSWLIA